MLKTGPMLSWPQPWDPADDGLAEALAARRPILAGMGLVVVSDTCQCLPETNKDGVAKRRHCGGPQPC